MVLVLLITLLTLCTLIISSFLLRDISFDEIQAEVLAELGPQQTLKIQSSKKVTAITYYQRGVGPDILLLHGIGASSQIYGKLVLKLSKNHRVTCLDWPGFGASPFTDQIDFQLDEFGKLLEQSIFMLQLKSPLIVGSSMGGAISLAALRSPTFRCRGWIGLAPAVAPDRWLLLVSEVLTSLHRVFTIGGPPRITVWLLLHFVLARDHLINRKTVARYVLPYINPQKLLSIRKSFKILRDPQLKNLVFPKKNIPFLIVYGERDWLVRKKDCETLCSQLTLQGHKVKLITHSQAGHHLMEDDPDWLLQTIQDFDSGASKT